MENIERKEAKTKKGEADGEKQNLAGVVREGAIAASIWRRQSPSGYAYFDFSISRSWKSQSSGKTGYSQNFFTRHEQELLTVIGRVSEEIAKLETAEAAAHPDQAIAA
jgi:hypothetical protein